MTSGRHSTPVRDRILDTASDLFYKEGIVSVGIDRILKESGAAKASLYSHFSSKDELVAQLLSRVQSPIYGLANVLNAPVAGLARALRQVAESKAEE